MSAAPPGGAEPRPATDDAAAPGPAGPGPVSFLSDYGLDDEFVGVVHRVIVAVAPGVVVVDVTHRIAPHDVRAGALTLWRAAPWLAPGVILAVVDPGVGTPRRPVAIEVAAAGAVLVGPDNGLLLPAAHALGPVTAAVALDPGRAGSGARPPRARGRTFDGRDLFAPAAARLAAGAPLTTLGDTIDPVGLTGDPVPVPATDPDGTVIGEVLWVDRFGNAQLNIGPPDADHLGPVVRLAAVSGAHPARRAAAYGELGPGEVGLVTDSYGLLSVSLNGAPAATALALRPGDPVRLGRPDVQGR